MCTAAELRARLRSCKVCLSVSVFVGYCYWPIVYGHCLYVISSTFGYTVMKTVLCDCGLSWVNSLILFFFVFFFFFCFVLFCFVLCMFRCVVMFLALFFP